MRRIHRAVAAAMLLVPVTTAGAELSRDPFRTPDGYVPATAAEPGEPAGPRRLLDVKAILLSGRKSLVNVGGRIVALGEEVDGYRLVAVRESEAVFSKGAERITVPVRPADNDQE